MHEGRDDGGEAGPPVSTSAYRLLGTSAGMSVGMDRQAAVQEGHATPRRRDRQSLRAGVRPCDVVPVAATTHATTGR